MIRWGSVGTPRENVGRFGRRKKKQINLVDIIASKNRDLGRSLVAFISIDIYVEEHPLFFSLSFSSFKKVYYCGHETLEL